MAMSDAELARIRSAFEECSRRLNEHEVLIAKNNEIIGVLTEQIQRLKNAVATVMAKAN